MTPEAAPIRTAPLALWRAAEGLLRTLHVLFGAPEDVAGGGALSVRAHRLMASWLRCAEAMLKRLLLIEAAALAKPNTRPPRRRARPRVRQAMAFTADQPQAWRVSFRVFMERRRPRRQPSPLAQPTPARAPALHDFRSAWPLAERYEALIRAFNDPAPYARRLARRMHASPHRLATILRAPPEAAHRVDGFAESGSCAESAWRAHFSSA